MPPYEEPPDGVEVRVDVDVEVEVRVEAVPPDEVDVRDALEDEDEVEVRVAPEEVEVDVEVDLLTEEEPDVPMPKVGLRSEVSIPDELRELPEPPEERNEVSRGFVEAGREVIAGRGGGSQ